MKLRNLILVPLFISWFVACSQNADTPSSNEESKQITIGVLTEQNIDSKQASSQEDDALSREQTAQLEASLLKSIEQIAMQQSVSIDDKHVSELEQLSEQDREVLRARAALDLDESAEEKALKNAQAEATNRGPVQ